VLRGDYADGPLPSESELMAGHGVSRATVREALALLRADGLIERTQGIGTHVVTSTVISSLAEAHGAVRPTGASMFNQRMRPRVLDRSVIPAPDVVARRLGASPGVSCLRLEYVALFEEQPVGLATNYVLFPAAAKLLACPFVSDWYALLAAADVQLGESEFVIGCELADPAVASELGVAEGTPVISLEQTITDPAGRPFDLAFVYTPANRFRFVSRALRYPGSAFPGRA
jgi:GntR family transcriptional regulator